MNQDINLLQKKRKGPQKGVSAGQLTVVSGVLILLMVGLKTGISLYQIDSLEDKYANIQGSFTVQKKRLDKLQTLQAKAEDPKTLKAVKTLEGRLEKIRTARNLLEQDHFSNRAGYSTYLKEFARRSVKGLWLTRISLVGAGQRITLRGRCTDPELLPRYIKRLARSEQLVGSRFNGLRINRPDKRDREHRFAYVDFVMSTDMESLVEPL